MTQIISAAGVGKATKYGKSRIALSMYGKGKAFVGAYLLVLRQNAAEPTQYVAAHLLGQGFEITLKAFLLFRNYDQYIGTLKPLGHDLVKTAEAVISAYGLKQMRPALKAELKGLSEPYSKHMLRYGNIGDIFIAPASISYQRVFRRLAAAIRLAERELSRVG
jgi:hypothetical protein